MNHINICPSCEYQKNCVLTAQKDKVWSCSEYKEVELDSKSIMNLEIPQNKKRHKLELV
ncbi:hypothetical protein [Winogradskyella marincola]|uniref:Uncharacterized protein n=1 Tax=Winogradskyella marincola TaxID=3037795 RepID=A0ABT6G1N7_9FLAO|nr:hypothetical protein [Winogradskyella sp. YYF002]MDG4715875.1 hypothetical protein [Winogradskyella sp. YYF002]